MRSILEKEKEASQWFYKMESLCELLVHGSQCGNEDLSHISNFADIGRLAIDAYKRVMLQSVICRGLTTSRWMSDNGILDFPNM